MERRKRNIAYSGMDRRRTTHAYEDDNSSGIVETLATVALVESIIDSSPTIDTSAPSDSTPSSDFGGFDGGSSGGGGSDSSW